MSDIIEVKQLSSKERERLKKKTIGYGKRTEAIVATGLDGTTLDKAKKPGTILGVDSLNKIRQFLQSKQVA